MPAHLSQVDGLVAGGKAKVLAYLEAHGAGPAALRRFEADRFDHKQRQKKPPSFLRMKA